jgi:hypothetical protein
MTQKTSKSATIDVVADELPEELADRLAGLLPADQLQDALKGLDPGQITGPGGLLSQLAGRVVNAALEGELTEHLGYPPGQAPPGGAGNHRNGSTPKTVKSDLGAIEVNTPRDRQGTFDPKLVAKRQTRLAGLDDRILGPSERALRGRDPAGTRSAGSPTPCWRTSRPGRPGRWI